ncbi:transporter [Croceicoccus bisphenolivorans]|uniref:transporter n=1 Tax=Croceicoccus bisphenolivorans TaxID=1783232 RepID=UPI0008370362|nr:transporter [Croceicoccus bisphenolivorans]
MKTLLTSGAAALLIAGAPLAHGQTAGLSSSAENPEITVTSPLLHPSAGLMNDHMHEGGEAMIGLRFERRRYSGENISGTDTIADADILAAGYTVRAQSMEMDMVMLDLMYAPSDKVTLMVMPHYMWHRMEMVGIDPMAGDMDMGMSDGHSGHAMSLGYGQTHAHGTEGFGDTLVSASYRLMQDRRVRAHATLGLWLPTGSTERKNADGTYVHYMMQPGGGTWDLEPSVTVSGSQGAAGWGLQGSYRWRTAARNDAGFAFGDKAQVSVWGSYLLAQGLGATIRAEYEHEGSIGGHYDGPHKHSSPADRQENYGGDTVSLGLGFNWLLPVGTRAPQLSTEIVVPVHQDRNGIQMPQDWRLSVGLSQTF